MERAEKSYRLVVAYHGREFSGWQAQAGARTVSAELGRALERLADGAFSFRAAGRTDAGVHARGQVVSVRMRSRAPTEKLVLALGSLLPDDVSVRSVEEMPSGFDAKKHSVGKRYVYRVLNHVARDPFLADRSWHVRGGLDLDAMREAARVFVGEHDFESFRAVDCDAEHARRYLWRVEVIEAPPLLEIEVRGNAFCRHMVRILAGTLVEVGKGRFSPADVARMLGARDRRQAGMTAPPHGLTLEQVYYPDALEEAGIPDGASFPGYPPSAETWPPRDETE